MKFFDWKSIPNLEEYLTDPRLDTVKDFMYRFILTNLYSEGRNTYLYHVLKDKSDEEIISIMKNTGLQATTHRGKNRKTYFRMLKYSDPRDISFYACNHLCDLVVIFIWNLCTLIWPKKKFLLVWSDNAEHAYVLEKNVPNIIYDINWYIFGTTNEDLKDFDMTPSHIYDNIDTYKKEILYKRYA